MSSNDFQQFIAQCGGSFNPIDGRQVWNWAVLTSDERLKVFHPDCNIVQYAPERFCTVGELRAQGFDEQPQPQAGQAWPQVLSAHSSEFIPARAAGTSVASTGLSSLVVQPQVGLSTAEELLQERARSNLTPLMRSASLGERTAVRNEGPSVIPRGERGVLVGEARHRATSDQINLPDAQTAGALNVRAGAVIQLRQAEINKLENCPDFWKMSLDELLEWRDGVEITDPTVLDYFEAAVGVAEVDLDMDPQRKVRRSSLMGG